MFAFFLRPMRIQFCYFLISIRSKSRMSVSDDGFAFTATIRLDLDIDLIDRETRRDENIVNMTIPRIVSGDQPDPLSSGWARRGENNSFTLGPLHRMKEVRVPARCPFLLLHRTEERRHLRDGAVQFNRERFRSLFQRALGPARPSFKSINARIAIAISRDVRSI